MPEIYSLNPNNSVQAKEFRDANSDRRQWLDSLSMPVMAQLFGRLLAHAKTLGVKKQKEVAQLLGLAHEKDISILKNSANTQNLVQSEEKSFYFHALLQHLAVASMVYEKPTAAQEKALRAKLNSTDYDQAQIDAWLATVRFNGGLQPRLTANAEAEVMPNPVFYAHYFWQIDEGKLWEDIMQIDFGTGKVEFSFLNRNTVQRGKISHHDPNSISIELHYDSPQVLAAQYLLQAHGHTPFAEREGFIGTFSATRPNTLGIGAGAVVLQRLSATTLEEAKNALQQPETIPYKPAIEHYLAQRRIVVPHPQGLDIFKELHKKYQTTAFLTGKWCFWILDSQGEHVDIFPFEVHPSGKMHGNVPLRGDQSYTGWATFEDDTLCFNFTHFGEKSMYSTYIFRPRVLNSLSLAFGTNVCVALTQQVPLARAVALMRNAKNLTNKHIPLSDADALAALETQVPEMPTIMAFLEREKHILIQDSPLFNA